MLERDQALDFGFGRICSVDDLFDVKWLFLVQLMCVIDNQEDIHIEGSLIMHNMPVAIETNMSHR